MKIINYPDLLQEPDGTIYAIYDPFGAISDRCCFHQMRVKMRSDHLPDNLRGRVAYSVDVVPATTSDLLDRVEDGQTFNPSVGPPCIDPVSYDVRVVVWSREDVAALGQRLTNLLGLAVSEEAT